MARTISRVARHDTVLTIALASVAPILYLVFIDHYATNSFYDDDWSVTPLITGALSGHLSLSQLWAQHYESRLFLGNIIDVVFGFIDRFDMRAVIYFNAALFIASYAVLLALLRQYLRTALTPIPVLVAGLAWFSLADVQNSLWAFQGSWYLTVLLFMVMLFALQVPKGRRTLWFAVAVIAAFAASLSTVQGFLCWPVGVIEILWSQPWARRASRETAVWCSATILTLVFYLRGYQFNNSPCHPTCSATSALHYPLTALGFFFALIGDVVPGGINFGGIFHIAVDYGRLQALGVALFTVAVFVLVQSCRYRASRERFPLPLLLIGFSLLFDVTITLGRGAGGLFALGNRYVMPNLILLTGVVMYACAHLPLRRLLAAHSTWRTRVAGLALLVLALFLIVQVTGATEFGLINGRATNNSRTVQAQLAVNLDRLPANPEWRCEVFAEFQFQPSWSLSRVRDAAEGHLGEFLPSLYRHYRETGPPALVPACQHFSGSLPRP